MRHAALVAAVGLSIGLTLPAFTQPKARCYVTKNGTNICYIRVRHKTFAAAVTDGTSTEPTVLHFTCGQRWMGEGKASSSDMQLIVSAICYDHLPTNDAPYAA